MPTPAKTIISVTIALAAGLLWAPMLKAEYADWYQVEVLIFANKTPTQTDESWPIAPLSYPAEMVTIAPEVADAIRPSSLSQLNEIRSYLAIFNEGLDVGAGAPIAAQSEGFLFESRNRLRAPSDIQNPAKPGSTEDPVTAINFEALFENNAPVAFKALPESQQLMNSLARSIQRSSLYKTLLHQSWLQPVSAKDDSIAVMIQAGDHYDDQYELDGTIRVSRSRFLHLETDLWYTEFAPLYQQDENASSIAASRVSPEIRRQFPDIAAWESNRGQYVPIHAHQLRQSRRMRSSTLHFIDHPRFGILVKIEDFESSPAD